MPSFILRDLDPEFWARVQAKAKAENTQPKAVILRLLAAWLAATCVVLMIGCAYKNPTAPSAETPAPPAAVLPTESLVTLTGHAAASNGGQALSGLSVTLSGQQAITDGEGGFLFDTRPGASARLTLDGPGIVPRSLSVAMQRSRDLRVDAISTAGFDLNFYRQVVRNMYDNGIPQPLRRWMRAPSIYLRTVDEAGRAIDARTVDTTDRAIRETLPIWTGGQFSANVERGTETREGQAGWLTVRFVAARVTPARCGQAHVAVEGGTIDFFYQQAGCECPGVSAMRPRTVRHELGHAMGFWHTNSPGDLMFDRALTCDLLPSARERTAAAIAYTRPIGNTDPDQDPSGAVTLTAMIVQ